jgi:hypothetical protein
LAAGVAVSTRVATPPIDRGGLGDHRLQRDPPQPTHSLGEVAGDIDRERRVEFPHHRQRKVAIVAIAVVEGEAGKAPREITLDQPGMHLVHSDDVDIKAANMLQHRAQKFRFDLEMAIGLEFDVAAGGTDMVQHEDGADACQDRSQQKVRAGKIKRLQPGADNGISELLHQGWGWPVRVRIETSEPPLKKRLSDPVIRL